MSITGILIILGCLVAGYWIVSSVMGPGIDVGEEGRKAETSKPRPPPLAPGKPTAKPALRHAPHTHDDSAMHDWYLVLDVSPDASRAEIQAAMKRRLAQAQSDGDTMAAARITRAAATGMKLRH